MDFNSVTFAKSCHAKDETMYYLKGIRNTLALLACNGDNLPAARVLSALSYIYQ